MTQVHETPILDIAHEPSTVMFRGRFELDDVGSIRTVPGRAAKNLPGVLAAGDCQDGYPRLATAAAGRGCMATIEAERWLAEHGAESESRAPASLAG